jgi:sulfatase modifying factor 1
VEVGEREWSVVESARTIQRQLDQLPSGTVIDNRYEVEAFSGQGGMGVVYKVRDRRNGDVLALKMLRPEKVSDEILRELSQSEARTGLYLYRKGVVHDNIAATYDMGVWSPAGGQAVPYFVMQFVAGPSLQTLLDEARRQQSLLPPEQVFRYLLGVASGVAAAHKAGVIHRDLKPGNVLIDAATDTAKVTDFGISVRQGVSTRERKAVQEFSTSLWAAPEQKAENHAVPESFATDVHALGKILYYALSGRYYDPDDYAPVGGQRHLPHAADDLIRTACRMNADRRYPHASAFLEALQDVYEQYQALKKAGCEDTPRVSTEVVQEKKAEYRALERMRAPWDLRIALLEELAAVAPRDPEVVKWMEAYNAYRRERLEAGLAQALAQGDAKSFSARLQEGVNLLAAAEVVGWRLRFASAQAEDQARARAYRAAQDLLRPFLTEGLPAEQVRALHEQIEEWGRLAERADQAAALRLSYERERSALSLKDREARLHALSLVAPELPELEAYWRELKEDQEAAARQAEDEARAERTARIQALAAQYDALPPGQGVVERRRLCEELARLDAADPRLETWHKEIAAIEKAEAIKAQLRGLALTRKTRTAYARKIKELRALMPQDPDLPGFAQVLEAFDRAEQAAEAAEEARQRGIRDVLEVYEALGPEVSAATREKLLRRLEGLDPHHERLAVWREDIKQVKARQQKHAAAQTQAAAPPPDKPRHPAQAPSPPNVSPPARAAQATGKQSRVKTWHRAALVVLLAVAVLAVGIVVYREAKARDSKYQALYEEGIAALQSHDFEAAVHAFTEAVRAKSTAEARAKLAEAERGQQQARKAGQYAEAVGRAQKFAANKEWALAKAAYEEALGYQDGPEARQGKARAEAALAQEAQALQAAERAQAEKRKAQASHRAGDTWVNPKDGLTYVWIPAGSFEMGAVPGDSDAYDEEKPRHPVEISKGFWLCRTEVTVKAYEKFCAATGRAMPEPPDFNPNWRYKDHPIVNVNWDDAVAYCQWAGGRLPTEAEWEYAARAGTETVYWWGNTYRQGMANCDEKYVKVPGGVYLAKTTPVGHYPANAWGLYDMLGNVYEWCADWYDKKYYASSPATDPKGPERGDGRVRRGGSWCSFPTSLRVSYRNAVSPSSRDHRFGFRCVRDE